MGSIIPRAYPRSRKNKKDEPCPIVVTASVVRVSEEDSREALARNHQLQRERRERERAEFERSERVSEAAVRLWGRKAAERLRAIREFLAQTSRRSKRHQAIEACMTAGDDNAIKAAWELVTEGTKP